MADLPKLNEHQLEIMRQSYPGFRKIESAARHMQEDVARYRNQKGYIPNEDQIQHPAC